MESFQNLFYEAIDNKKVLLITFASDEKGVITRHCIPYDFAPSRGNINKPFKYQTFDLENNHNLAILPQQIINMQLSNIKFDPEIIVTWTPKWFYKRDWGSKS